MSPTHVCWFILILEGEHCYSSGVGTDEIRNKEYGI